MLARRRPRRRRVRVRGIRTPRLACCRHGKDALGREPGDALWPELRPLEELARRRTAVGARIWQAQNQGSPTAPEGNLFKRDWWQYIDTDELPEADLMVPVWDLGYSEDGDWTAGILMHVHHASDGIFFADVARFRHTSRKRDKRIKEVAARDGDGIIIALTDDLGQSDHFTEHMLPGYLIEPITERRSKPECAVSFAARVEPGDVYLLRAPWNADCVNELAGFPTGSHDDQVDPSANAYTLITDPRFQPLAFA